MPQFHIIISPFLNNSIAYFLLTLCRNCTISSNWSESNIYKIDKNNKSVDQNIRSKCRSYLTYSKKNLKKIDVLNIA